MYVSVVGARPNFIKLSPVDTAIKKKHVIVHTGQHYDYEMSQAFFDQMKIPKPDYNLGIGAGTHAEHTAMAMARLEPLFKKLSPEAVITYGDVDSTLAAALTAAKMHIPTAHVESGLRSFDRSMPEEINRIATDHCSDLLFAPTKGAVTQLKKEGLKGVFTGDVMLDVFMKRKDTKILKRQGFTDYYLATVHRASNTDDPKRLSSIFKAFASLDREVLMPLHPRTSKALRTHRIKTPNVRLLPPLSYGDFTTLLAHSAKVFTDSGGAQKEAFFARVPCVTLRDTTEWTETIAAKANTLAGWQTKKILAAAKKKSTPDWKSRPYGDGHAAKKIAKELKRL